MKKVLMTVLLTIMLFSVNLASAMLIPVDMSGLPDILSDTTGRYTYNSATNFFSTTAIPLTITFGTTPTHIFPGGTYAANFHVDEFGNFQSGVPGDDLKITGCVDTDGDGHLDYTGILLTGEIIDFGFKHVQGTFSMFNYIFNVTGGALTPFFPNKGVDFITGECTTFNGSWHVHHNGSKIKHDTSPTPTPLPLTLWLMTLGLPLLRLKEVKSII